MTETLLIVDGYSLAFRAFFGMPDTLRDPKGEPVNVVYGFLSVLFNRIALLKTRHVAIAWDIGRPWREDDFPDYKVGRQDIDPAVEVQVERLKPVLTAMKIAQYGAERYEADDVMATLARQAGEHGGFQTVILSGDRDMFGVIDATTTILYPTRSMNDAELYDTERLFARWGIAPKQVADFKALVGDSSDNIPGVRGIGEKGAAKLLVEYGTLDGIYANLEQIRPDRTRNALIAGRESAYLSQKLATLISNVPTITFEPLQCALQYDYTNVEPLWDELGFQRLRERMPTPPNP